MYTLGSYFTIFIVGWLIWLVIWIILWRWSKTTERVEMNSQEIIYRILLWFAFVLALADLRVVPILNIRLFSSNSTTIIIGAIILYVGVALAIWARKIIAKNWSHKTELKKSHELIKRGPYKIIRNPIYTGLLLMFLGTAIATGIFASALAVVFAVISFLIRIQLEEKLLHSHFGAKFAEYKKKTWALLPFIY